MKPIETYKGQDYSGNIDESKINKFFKNICNNTQDKNLYYFGESQIKRIYG